jgi:hypothetical protein
MSSNYNEDILIEEIKEYISNFKNIMQTTPPHINSSMWENEDFVDKFINLFLDLIQTVNNNTNFNSVEKNLLKMIISMNYGGLNSFINTTYKNSNGLGYIEEFYLKQEKYKRIILEYIKEVAPDNVWLLFKLREE